MSQILWRIATDAPAYEADDLSGKGAEITGGRWNAKDIPAVYTSLTQSLACLETVVHLGAVGLPLNRYLVQIEVADSVWSQVERAKPQPSQWAGMLNHLAGSASSLGLPG